MPKSSRRNKPSVKSASGRGKSRVAKLINSNTVQGSSLGPSKLRSFIPDTFHAKHKYVEGFILTGSATGVLGSQYVYSLNGLYDPYLGAGGHQAYGFDQLTPWYNSYCVTSCHVSILCTTASTDSAFIGIGWKPSVGGFTINGLGVSDMGEKDNARWALVPKVPARASDAVLDLGTFNIAQMEGRTASQIRTEDDYQGTVVGNPTLGPSLMVALGDLGGANGTTANFVITLSYTTTWRGRKTQAQS